MNLNSNEVAAANFLSFYDPLRLALTIGGPTIGFLYGFVLPPGLFLSIIDIAILGLIDGILGKLNKQLDNAEIRIKRTIGQGSFGAVYDGLLVRYGFYM